MCSQESERREDIFAALATDRQPSSLPRPVSGLTIEFQGTSRAHGPALRVLTCMEVWLATRPVTAFCLLPDVRSQGGHG